MRNLNPAQIRGRPNFFKFNSLYLYKNWSSNNLYLPKGRSNNFSCALIKFRLLFTLAFWWHDFNFLATLPVDFFAPKKFDCLCFTNIFCLAKYSNQGDQKLGFIPKGGIFRKKSGTRFWRVGFFYLQKDIFKRKKMFF